MLQDTARKEKYRNKHLCYIQYIMYNDMLVTCKLLVHAPFSQLLSNSLNGQALAMNTEQGMLKLAPWQSYIDRTMESK